MKKIYIFIILMFLLVSTIVIAQSINVNKFTRPGATNVNIERVGAKLNFTWDDEYVTLLSYFDYQGEKYTWQQALSYDVTYGLWKIGKKFGGMIDMSNAPQAVKNNGYRLVFEVVEKSDGANLRKDGKNLWLDNNVYIDWRDLQFPTNAFHILNKTVIYSDKWYDTVIWDPSIEVTDVSLGVFNQTFYNTTSEGVAIDINGGFSSGTYLTAVVNLSNNGSTVPVNNLSWSCDEPSGTNCSGSIRTQDWPGKGNFPNADNLLFYKTMDGDNEEVIAGNLGFAQGSWSFNNAKNWKFIHNSSCTYSGCFYSPDNDLDVQYQLDTVEPITEFTVLVDVWAWDLSSTEDTILYWENESFGSRLFLLRYNGGNAISCAMNAATTTNQNFGTFQRTQNILLGCRFNGTHLSSIADGILNPNPTAGTFSNVLKDIYLGNDRFGNDHFAGSIDRVFIFNRSLTQAEILAFNNTALWGDFTSKNSTNPIIFNNINASYVQSKIYEETDGVDTPLLNNVTIGYGSTGGAPPAPVAPVITNLRNLSTTNESSIINWTTDKSANATLTYGVCPSITGTTLGDSSLSLTHNFTLNSLLNSTTYCMNASNIDTDDLTAYNATFSFTTAQNIVPPDTTPPSYTNNQNNASTLTKINGNVNFSIDAADDIALKNITFYWNQSGSWVEADSMILSGTTAPFNTTQTITLSQGNYICGNYSIVDSSDNVNNTVQSCFTVANTAPTQGTPTINSSLGTNLTTETLQCFNVSTSDADGDLVTNSYKWFEDTVVIGGQTASTLASSNTQKGSSYLCEIAITDGIDSGIPKNSTGLTILNTPPTTPTIINPETGDINNTINMNFFSTDADSDSITYRIYINGTINRTDISANITNWQGSDGFYNMTMTANDGTDTSANSSSTTFTLDTTAPVVNIVYPTNLLNISSNSIDLNATAVDNFNNSDRTFYWVINGTTNTTTVDTNSTLGASDGFYNLTLFVSDGLQNGSDTVLFTLDTVAPPINNLVNTSTGSTSSNIDWDSTETHNYSLLVYNSTVLVFSQASALFDTSRSISATGLTSGDTHTVNLTICDRSSNCDTNKTFTFTTTTVDLTPPTISDLRNLSTTNISSDINWTTNELANSTITYGVCPTLDTNTQTNSATRTNQGFTLTGLVNSTNYCINASSTDASGNTGYNATFNFTTAANLDLTAPIITNLRNTSTTNISSFIEWTCSESCNYSIVWTGGSISNNSFSTTHDPFLSSLLNSTTYIINLTVWDSSGNNRSNNTFSFTTAANVVVIPPVSTGLEFNLTMGWNLLPQYNTSDLNLSVLATQLGDNITLMSYWNSSNASYTSSVVGWNINANQIVPEGESYFAYSEVNKSVGINYTFKLNSYTLPIGWNVLFVKNSTGTNISLINASMKGNVTIISYWNNTNKLYTSAVSKFTINHNKVVPFLESFWLLINSETSLVR